MRAGEVLLKVVLSLMLLPSAVQADDICRQAKVQQRPCVALVLGGGGARGGAHLGVIEQLEQQQIPVDLVVGTSIGAFIGGLYASGFSASEISAKLAAANWAEGFRDRVYRDEMPMRRKEHSDQFALNVDLGLSADGIKLPQGLLFGQALADLLQSMYGTTSNKAHFDTLPVPFRAIATDLLTQQQVVLDRGSLVQAVQASMTIPGVVAPMELDDRLLVDGGVVNNLPVSVAKQLGADRVIAVSIDAPLLNKQQMMSALNVTHQLTAFLVRAGVQQQLQLLDEDDLLLSPVAEGVATLAFERIDEAVTAGRAAAQAAQPQLASFSQPQWYAGWRQAFLPRPDAAITIDNIELENISRLDDRLLLRRLEFNRGDAYTPRKLHKGLRQLYGVDTFERVSQQLITEADGSNTLHIRAEEKSWGPGYLNFHFQLEDDFRNTHQYQLAGAYTLTNLTRWGAEWHTTLGLGNDKSLYTEAYLPFADSGLFALAGIGHRREVQVLQSDSGLSEGELRNSRNLAITKLGWNISDHAELTLGWGWQNGRLIMPGYLAEQFGSATLDYRSRGPELQLVWDTLDSRSFPSRGIRLATSVRRSTDNTLTLQGDSTRTSTELLAAKSWHPHVLRTRWYFDRHQADETAISFDQFSLGGFLNLSGYPADLLYGSDIQFGSFVYLYQINQPQISFFNAPLYIGGSLERGRVKANVFGEEQADDTTDWLWAGSVFVGWDTPFGPLYLGYGHAERSFIRQNSSVYLSFGKSY